MKNVKHLPLKTCGAMLMLGLVIGSTITGCGAKHTDTVVDHPVPEDVQELTDMALPLNKKALNTSAAVENVETLNVELLTGVIDPTKGKPGAPIVLSYSLPKVINLGDIVDVELRFTTRTPKGSLGVNMNTPKGLGIMSDAKITHMLNNKKEYVSVVNIQANENGNFYLNILAKETPLSGHSMGRAFAVPINVGDADINRSVRQEKSSRNKVQDASGRWIIQMPAEETIR